MPTTRSGRKSRRPSPPSDSNEGEEEELDLLPQTQALEDYFQSPTSAAAEDTTNTDKEPPVLDQKPAAIDKTPPATDNEEEEDDDDDSVLWTPQKSKKYVDNNNDDDSKHPLLELLCYEMDLFIREEKKQRPLHFETLCALYKQLDDIPDNIKKRYTLCCLLGDIVLDEGSMPLWKVDDWQEVLNGAKDYPYDEQNCIRKWIHLLEFHQLLSPIRNKLQVYAANNDGKGPSQSKLNQVLAAINKCDKGKMREKLRLLFVFPKTDESSTDEDDSFTNGVLKPPKEVAEILAVRVFSFDYLKERTETAITLLYKELYETSQLYKLGYHRHYAASPGRFLRMLRRDLDTKHGDDPLEESRRLAAIATGVAFSPPRTPRQVSQERRATFLLKDDSDDADDVPSPVRQNKKPRITFATAAYYQGPPPDPGIFDDKGRVLQRIPFSASEIEALEVGVVTYGEGKWVYIKNMFPQTLRNRTSTQLKDKWRNLRNKDGYWEDLKDRYDRGELALPQDQE